MNTSWKASIDGKQAVEVVSEHLDLQELPDGSFSYLSSRGTSHHIVVLSVDLRAKEMLLEVDGRNYNVSLSDTLDQLIDDLGLEANPAPKLTEIYAPMPGLVLRLEVGVDEEVAEDQTLLVLEAMKMENAIKASANAKVKQIHISEGTAVEKGALLISFYEE